MNTDRFFEKCDQNEFVSNAYMGFVIAIPRVAAGGRPLDQTTLIGVERGSASYFAPVLIAALAPLSLFGRSWWSLLYTVGSVVGASLVVDGGWFSVRKRIHIRTFPRIHPPKM